MRKPEIMCFAGPNGSGKSTNTRTLLPYVHGQYVNADAIQDSLKCTTLEAAIKAEEIREKYLSEKKDFSFETVLSTERNLHLLQRAKEAGYFIRCVFVLTSNPQINVERVAFRVSLGGHGVPKEKIISRYEKSLLMLKKLPAVCDRLSVYDIQDKA